MTRRDGGGGGWRVPARLARREARRRPWRTLLMVALIGLPVAGAVGTAPTMRSVTRTADEARTAEFGTADDIVSLSSAEGGPDAEDRLDAAVRATYPAGSRYVTFHEGPDALETPDRSLEQIDVSDRPLDEPLLEGTTTLLHGRTPERAGEAVLNEAALAAVDAHVGDEVDLLLGGRVRVVGEFVDETNQWPAVVSTEPPADHPQANVTTFVDLPAGAAIPDRAALDAIHAGYYDGNYHYLVADLRNQLTATYVVTGVVLVVAAIVASAAFAVGARRQLRTLGLLSAAGAPPVALRRAVVLQGTVTGAVASLLGGALGLAGAAALNPWLDDIMNRTVPSLRVHPLDLVVPIGLGIVAATAAASVPARHASRIPVLAALAGRRPAGRVPVGVPIAGAAAVGAGAVILALWTRLDDPPWGVGLAAALVVLLGATALAPWVVSHTEPLAARLRGGGRVAARGLARHRLRSGAVVAAVMAPAGLSIFATSAALTNDARDRANEAAYAQDDFADNEVLVTHVGAPPDEVDRVLSVTREALPGAEEFPVLIALPRTAGSAPGEPVPPAVSLEINDPAATFDADGYQGPSSRFVIVATTEGLRRLGVPGPTVDALAAGKIVVFDAVGPDATVRLVGAPVPIDRGDIAADPMTRVPKGSQVAHVSPETARRWGVRTLEYATFFRAPTDLTEAQQAAIRSATDSDPDEWLRRYLLDPASLDSRVSTTIGAESDGSSSGASRVLPWVAAGASLVFTLLVVAAALALDGSESADERSLLAAIGAPPAVRRSIVAWQAFLLPALAAAVAVPVGMLVSWAVLSDNRDTSGPGREVAVQVPWVAAALLLLVVPLVTAGVTWLAAALRGRRRRDLATLALAAD